MVMPMRPSTVARLVAITLALVAGACGTRDTDDGGRGHAQSDRAATATTTDGHPVEFVGISGVEAAAGASVTVRSDPVPVESAAGECAVEITPWAQESNHEVIVYVGYTGGVVSPFEGCEVAPRTVEVALASPVGTRAVVDGMGARFWLRDGAWVGCGDVVMTCITEPASCDNLRDAISNADVPRHFGMSNTRCDGAWAVVDVDLGAGDCPVTGDGPNPCAGQRLRRMYWQVQADAWVQVGSDRGPGCGSIADIVPDFPSELCAGLPALPQPAAG
jgi:hypothetical protein